MDQTVNRPSSRGFSLAEVLFSLFLTGLVMAVTARLFHGYSDYSRHSRVKDHEFDVGRHILTVISGELCESFSSTYVSASSTLELQKKDPGQVIPPSPLLVAYRPRDAANSITISYVHTPGDRSFRRQVGGSSQLLSKTIDGFDVTQSGRSFEIRITLRQKTKISTLNAKAFRWADS